ncbi:MAG: hypothetical protein JNJ54_23170 [Myxococcaceae bacterium]|nr:hypothetical protein [Myxococcaceae bacterium]
MHPFEALRTSLSSTIAGPWAKQALRFAPVDVEAYETLFLQTGLTLPAPLRAELISHGAFEWLPIRDEEAAQDEELVPFEELLREVRVPWAGRNLLSRGLHLLTPAELLQTFRSQRAAASAWAPMGAMWVFAAPRDYLWAEAFAFDTRFREYAVVPFHEDAIGESLEVAQSGPLRHSQANLTAWAQWLCDQISMTVERLAREEPTRTFEASSPPVAQPIELRDWEERVAGGALWSSFAVPVWREALRSGPSAMAARVLDDVGTLVTKGSIPDYQLPSPIDLLHRLPLEGPTSRRAAVLEMWAHRRPGLEVAAPVHVAFDLFLSRAHQASVAPREVLRELTPIAWADRGPAADEDTRWARALLWALGPAEPERLAEATSQVLSSGEKGRALLETMWLRLVPFAQRAGVL